MKIIRLTRSMFTIVDDADYGLLSQFQWKAHECSGRFYACRQNEKHDSVYMHRQLLGFPAVVDHRNGLTLDNRRNNLRKATTLENIHNKMPRRLNECGFIGVRKAGQKNGFFQAYISKDSGKFIHLGQFPSAIEAAKVRDAAALKLRGEFAVLNFINGKCRTITDDIIQPETTHL